jgi:hypothetical protein
MNMDFKFLALSEHGFESFFSMSDSELAEHGALWIEVDSSPGYPCRISLEDAKVGERVLAMSFAHHDVKSPYNSSGPIFVRENAKRASLEINQVPVMLRHRQLSIRGYTSDAMMIGADVVDGEQLESHLHRLFQNPSIEYIHVHNAKPGCFNCTVVRA